MRFTTLCFCIFCLTTLVLANEKEHPVKKDTSSISLPNFIPRYFEQVFPNGLADWEVENTEVSEYGGFLILKNDLKETIEIQHFKAGRTLLKNIFQSKSDKFLEELKLKGGEIYEMDQFLLKIKLNENDNKINFVVMYGTAVEATIWEYKMFAENQKEISDFSESLSFFIRRKQYEEAFTQGNVSMGAWETQVHKYAQMLAEKDPKEAEIVYRNHLKTASYNYEAHYEFTRLSNNKQMIAESAKAIFKNAEDKQLLDESANILGNKIVKISDFPYLDKGEKGLQLILIPLPPCNPWLLKEAAVKYEEITGIPVKIRRLHEVWKLEKPERIPRQRFLEKLVSQIYPEVRDFSDWDFERFRKELYKVAEKEGPISVYYINKLFEEIEQKDGQWKISPYLKWFQKTLLKYNSNDPRTMYVGITKIDIFSEDNNFIFSLHGAWKKSQASILSYARMLAKFTEEYQSRKRLVGRIAKELVPASLKSLGISRSVDPTCPYSYANGVGRLDQKTFELSENVIEAIKKYRTE